MGIFRSLRKREKTGIDFLVAGLGNPGREYQRTRHNIGFRVATSLSGRQARRRKFSSSFSDTKLAGKKITVIKPQTYMNRSGAAVGRWLQHLNLGPDRLIVIHDDIDLPLGKIRIKNRGGPGGHRGVKSIIDALGSEDFVRVRIGIGRPDSRGGEADFVLSNFSPAEKEKVSAAVETACRAVAAIIASGVEEAQQGFN